MAQGCGPRQLRQAGDPEEGEDLPQGLGGADALAVSGRTGGRALTAADWLEIWLPTWAHVWDKTLRGYSAHVRLHLG